MLRTIPRVKLSDMNLSPGKRVRLHRLLYEHGPANGTLLLLPIDQGLEHGPVDFFDNPDSLDPDFQFRLAVEAGFQVLLYTLVWPRSISVATRVRFH